MNWLLAILIRIIPASILAAVFMKKIIDEEEKDNRDNYEIQARKLNIAFLLCSCFSLLFCLHSFYLSGINPFTYSIFAVMVMGILNSLANVFKWRSVGIGMAKSYLFFGGKDIIAIILGFLFLNGTKLLNPLTALGIILSFCTYAIIGLQKYAEQKEKTNQSRNSKLIKYAAGFSLVWGFLQFFEGWFAFKQSLSPAAFITGWYSGSYFGSLLLIQKIRKKTSERGLFNITAIKKTISVSYSFRNIAIFSFSIWISLLLSYIVILKTHLNIALPILMSVETVLPCLLGLYYFKEKKYITKLEKIAIITGFASAIAVAVGYYC